MCQPLPGPRCSRHAADRVRNISNRLDSLIVEYNAVKHGRSQHKNILLEQIETLQSHLAEAQRDYNCTPRGIGELCERVSNHKLSSAATAEIQMILDIAIEDKNAHIIASKISARAKNIESDKVLQLRDVLLYKESQANMIMAQALNEREPNSQRFVTSAWAAKRKRLAFEEELRRRTAEVGEIKHISAAEAVNSEHNIFIAITSAELGRVGAYIPYGAYAKVISSEPTVEGNISLTLEGGVNRIVSRHTSLVSSK